MQASKSLKYYAMSIVLHFMKKINICIFSIFDFEFIFNERKILPLYKLFKQMLEYY